MSRIQRTYDFIREVQADEHFNSQFIRARLKSNNPLVKTNRVTEIRSKRHTADVIAYDVLGNVTVLWADGSIRQYLSDKEVRAAGITG